MVETGSAAANGRTPPNDREASTVAISPAELQSRVEQDTVSQEPEQVLESYAEVWQEREELRARLASAEAELERIARPLPDKPARRRPKPVAAVVHVIFAGIALIALAAFVAMLAIVSGLYELDERGLAAPKAPSAAAAPAVVDPVTAPAGVDKSAGVEADRASVAAPPPVLQLTAALGESWIQVLEGSPSGEVLYEGVLGAGQSESFPGKRFVLRLGAPANLEAEFGNEPLELPTGTAEVAVRDGELRILSTG